MISRLFVHSILYPTAALTGAERSVSPLELLTRGKVLAFGIDTLVVVDVVLLLGVGKRADRGESNKAVCGCLIITHPAVL